MTAHTPARPARRWALPSILIPVLALLALLAWGFASPVGAGPDDDFHLSSTWCGGTTSTELCAPGSVDDERLVSPDLFSDATCYAFDPLKSAGCQGADFGDDLTAGLTSSDRGNFAGLYPPVYYFVTSLFAGDNLETSALVMRALTSVLFVGLMTALYFLLPTRRRTTLIASVAVTIVPLGMFLIPSNNPSGWAILSAATLWMALLGYFETSGIRRVLLAVLAVLATVIGAGARADSAIYAGIAIVAVLILTARRGGDYLRLAILPVGLVALALVGFFSANQASAATSGLAGGAGAGYGAYALIVNNLIQLPSLLTGAFGVWGLGWLDTAMPAIVQACAIGAVVGAVVLGLRARSRRKSLAALFVAATVLAVPMYILYRSDAIVGSQVQPRYILPLIILFVGIVLLRPEGAAPVFSRGTVLLIAGALSVANAVALHANIRRYVTGTDVIGGNLDTDAEWWWNVPFSPMAMWFVGAAAFTATVFWLAACWITHARVADELLPEQVGRRDGIPAA